MTNVGLEGALGFVVNKCFKERVFINGWRDLTGLLKVVVTILR